MKVVRLSALSTGRLYPRPRRWVTSWVDPRAIARPEVLSQWKTPMTPSGIEPATFPLLAQCLNWLWVHCSWDSLQFPYSVILCFYSNDTFFYISFSAVEIPTIFFHFHDKLVPHILFYFQHNALKNKVVILVVVVVVIFFSFIHYWWTIANIWTNFTRKVSTNSSRTNYINKYCLFQQKLQIQYTNTWFKTVVIAHNDLGLNVLIRLKKLQTCNCNHRKCKLKKIVHNFTPFQWTTAHSLQTHIGTP